MTKDQVEVLRVQAVAQVNRVAEKVTRAYAALNESVTTTETINVALNGVVGAMAELVVAKDTLERIKF